MSNIADEILKTIKYAVDRKAVNCDRTYRTVIKRITPKGYIILDSTGSERTVPCYIPNVTLRVGQTVYVKEPMGRVNELFICNVIEHTGNLNRRSRRR